MDFEKFKSVFFSKLKGGSKDCIAIIERNYKLVEAYLSGNENVKTINQFINSFNEIILENKKFKYSLTEKIFKIPCMKSVSEFFRESDILIQACKTNNINAIKWLMTMNINLLKQDDDGMTALMHAVKRYHQLFFVKKYTEEVLSSFSKNDDDDPLNIKDRNGENVLFHAIKNTEAFKFLVGCIPALDVNCVEYSNNETVLIRCAKSDRVNFISLILERPDVDINIVDSKGWPISFYLAKKGLCHHFIDLDKKQCNYFYENHQATHLNNGDDDDDDTLSGKNLGEIAMKHPPPHPHHPHHQLSENVLSIAMNELYRTKEYDKIYYQIENYYKIIVHLMKN